MNLTLIPAFQHIEGLLHPILYTSMDMDEVYAYIITYSIVSMCYWATLVVVSLCVSAYFIGDITNTWIEVVSPFGCSSKVSIDSSSHITEQRLSNGCDVTVSHNKPITITGRFQGTITLKYKSTVTINDEEPDHTKRETSADSEVNSPQTAAVLRSNKSGTHISGDFNGSLRAQRANVMILGKFIGTIKFLNQGELIHNGTMSSISNKDVFF